MKTIFPDFRKWLVLVFKIYKKLILAPQQWLYITADFRFA